ncbi:MAG TPA: hypothetical protein EYP09_06200, partial [Anaerolineae bacterium]|nr:hypothetical protein [Anaerolineae bacterium]
MLAILIVMNVAVRANVRTVTPPGIRRERPLTLALCSGATMVLSVVALNLPGIFLLAYLFGVRSDNPEAVSLLVSFGFGASHSSLFAQLGGGLHQGGGHRGRPGGEGGGGHPRGRPSQRRRDRR